MSSLRGIAHLIQFQKHPVIFAQVLICTSGICLFLALLSLSVQVPTPNINLIAFILGDHGFDSRPNRTRDFKLLDTTCSNYGNIMKTDWLRFRVISLNGMTYNENGYSEHGKRQQPHRDEKCQLQANHGSSVNDEKTLTPQGKLQLAPKQYYTRHSEIVVITDSINIKDN